MIKHFRYALIVATLAVGMFGEANSQKAELPAHAILNVYGNDWICENGYRKSGQRCVRVNIPEHGTLNVYGNDWTCENGYRKSGQRCIRVNIPEHGTLNVYGNDWTCEHGYRKSGQRCVQVGVMVRDSTNESRPSTDTANSTKLQKQLEELRKENARLIAERNSAPKVVKKAKPRIDRQQRLELARRTQEALQVLGLYSGKLDGIIGVKTKSAIRRWQMRNGYPGTGDVNRVQLARLENEAIARLAKKKSEPRVADKIRPPPRTKSGTSGSGFFVSKSGHVVTNEHVVRSCKLLTMGDNAKTQVRATVIETDKRNDLALLKISSTEMASEETKSLIRKLGSTFTSNLGLKVVPLSSNGLLRSDDVELGEGLLVAGYPYGEIFSNTIKVTKGIVSAIRGIGDDSGQFQLDAAVQPGNSGGPIYDENGNIVGVVVAQLNKLKMAKTIGSLPENVNFGIKASTVRQFLTSAGLPTKWSSRTNSMSNRELAKIAKNQTVMVVCHR